MRAGEIVITGSALRTRFPEAGDEIIYRIAGLGEARARIVAQN
jgi:2-keto-4-pentenoate hydratase